MIFIVKTVKKKTKQTHFIKKTMAAVTFEAGIGKSEILNRIRISTTPDSEPPISDVFVMEYCDNTENYIVTPEDHERYAVISEACVVMDMFDGLHDVIGKGVNGSVYKTKMASGYLGNSPVAVKKCKIDLIEKDGFIDSWLREVILLEKFSGGDKFHRNVACMLHAVRTEVSTYIIFPLYEFSLHSLIKNNTFGDQINLSNIYDLKRVSSGIIMGLACLHSRGVIHRDIKPDNIMFDAAFNPVIIDFGLAYNDDRMPEHEKMKKMPVVFAPMFRPLEVFMGMRNYSHKVDIWATACVFYEMVARRHLFHIPEESAISTTFIEMINKIGPMDEKSHFIRNLPFFFDLVNIQHEHVQNINEKFMVKNSVANGIYKGLLTEMLNFDASKRPDCQYILEKIRSM